MTCLDRIPCSPLSTTSHCKSNPIVTTYYPVSTELYPTSVLHVWKHIVKRLLYSNIKCGSCLVSSFPVPVIALAVPFAMDNCPDDVLGEILYAFFAPADGNFMHPIERRRVLCGVNRRFQAVVTEARFWNRLIIFRFTPLASLRNWVRAAPAAGVILRLHLEPMTRVRLGWSAAEESFGEDVAVTCVPLNAFFTEMLPELKALQQRVSILQVSSDEPRETVAVLAQFGAWGLPRATGLTIRVSTYTPEAADATILPAPGTTRVDLFGSILPVWGCSFSKAPRSSASATFLRPQATKGGRIFWTS